MSPVPVLPALRSTPPALALGAADPLAEAPPAGAPEPEVPPVDELGPSPDPPAAATDALALCETFTPADAPGVPPVDELGLCRHYRVDVLVGARNLIENSFVLTTFHTCGLSLEIRERKLVHAGSGEPFTIELLARADDPA